MDKIPINYKWIPGDDSKGASGVSLLYLITRSVEFIILCNSVACLMHHENVLVEAKAEEMINPASLLLRSKGQLCM